MVPAQGASLEATIADVASADPVVVKTALVELRKSILREGASLKRRVADSPLLEKILTKAIDNGVEMFVAEAAMRVLCTIAAKNVVARDAVLRNAELIPRILSVIDMAAAFAVSVPMDVDGDDSAAGAEHAMGGVVVAMEALDMRMDGEDVPDVVVDDAPLGDAERQSPVIGFGCGAAWALCALLGDNAALKTQLLAHAGLLANVGTLLRLTSDTELPCGATWVVMNLCMGVANDVVTPIVLSNGILPVLLRNMRVAWNTGLRGLSSRVVGMLIFRNPALHQAVLDAGGIDAVFVALSDPRTDTPATSATIWALLAMLRGSADAVAAVVAFGNGKLVDLIVALLRRADLFTVHNAADCIYQLACRNQANQALVVDHGLFPAALAFLQRGAGNSPSGVQAIHAVFSALLAVLSKNQETTVAFSLTAGMLSAVVKLFRANAEPKTRGLMAGIVRMVCVDNIRAQSFFGATGVIADMLDCFPAAPGPHAGFLNEQTCAALVNLTMHHLGNFELFWVLGGEEKLLSFVATENNVGPASSPLALACAIICLKGYGGDISGAARVRMRAFPDFTARLTALAHGNESTEVAAKLRLHAKNLLEKLLTIEELAASAL